MKKTELPCPRLQLEWIKTGKCWGKSECIYSLVLPLGPYDIRAENTKGKRVKEELIVVIGRTESKGSSLSKPPVYDGKVSTPYRDGAHATFDSLALNNLPVFAICEDACSQVVIDKGIIQ